MSFLPASVRIDQFRCQSGAGAFPLSLRLASGLFISVGVGLFIVGFLAAIWHAADLFDARPPAEVDIFHLLRMSFIQAGLSVILALFAGGIIAIALSRVDFVGKSMIVALLSAGLVLPTLIVAFGLLAIWGRAGVVNQLYGFAGFGRLPVSIFGLHGILAAHTILNGSFAARIFLDRLQAIPVPVQKLGRALDLNQWQRFTILDWPNLREAVPGLAATIFLMCFTSFSVVLLLGGGPNNSTFEVAIFAAVRLEFDLHQAAFLAAVQLFFCLVIILPTAGLKNTGLMIDTPGPVLWPARGVARWTAYLVLTILMLAYASPLVAVIYKGLDPAIADLVQKPRFIQAFTTSIIVAVSSAVLATILALILALARAEIIYRGLEKRRADLFRTAISAPVFLYLATPASVLGLGFFLIARLARFDTDIIGIPVLITANTLMTLPFAQASLGPPAEKIANRYRKLARCLALANRQRILLLEFPILRPVLLYVFTVSFCFSLGDLGVIALFGSSDLVTLPWLMYQALGSYRTNDASMIASLLLLLSIGCFFLFPALAGRTKNA